MIKRKPVLLKVVVNRKRWYRGQGNEHSCLLLPNNKMCCIGFLARAQGYKPREIRGIAELGLMTSETARHFNKEYSNTLISAYNVNDSTELSDADREHELVTLGRRMGVQFTFIN